MTALLPATPDVRAETRPSSGRLVLALARPEARRLLRTPLVWIGLALTVFFTWAVMRSPDDWSGARYMVAPVLVGPWLATLSFAVAGSFHRERSGLAADAPVGEEVRSVGLLGGAAVLVLLVAVVTAVGGVAARWHGGFDLGDEPGRTLHAHFSWPELIQPVVLAMLAVAVGAAAGRRFAHRATATLALFIGWFPFVMVSWAFQSRAVTPFSILQIQPVSLRVGPVDADPLSFPSTWLLSAPGEYQDHWARLLVSVPLGVGHNVWLLGLTCLFLAVALPRRLRAVLLGVGSALAIAGVALQYVAMR